MNELKNRGVGDILIAVVDGGLKGFPDAINAVFPETLVQTCIVHLLRHSLDFVSWKDRKAVAAALKEIYRAKDAVAGEKPLYEITAIGQRLPGGKRSSASCPPSSRPRRTASTLKTDGGSGYPGVESCRHNLISAAKWRPISSWRRSTASFPTSRPEGAVEA